MNNNIPEAKLLRKKLKNGLIVDKWDLVNLIEQQQDKLTKYELRHAEQRKRIDELETMLRQQQAEIELLNAKLAYMFEQELKTARLNK